MTSSRSLSRTLLIVDSTAYAETGQQTASGAWPRFMVTVASNTLAFGTRIRVIDGPLVGSEWVVEDRIGCCSELDFYLQTHDRAVEYGRRQITIEVIK